MSQHRVTFKRKDAEGLRFSHCGRFIIKHVPEDRCRYDRWRLLDLEQDGREVHSARLMKHCRDVAGEILAGTAVIDHVPVEQHRAQVLAEEAAAAAAYQEELDAIEAELLLTDAPCDDEPPAEDVTITRRDPVRTVQVNQHWETTVRLGKLREEQWDSLYIDRHVVPAKRPPVPRAWVDLVARVYAGGALRLVERRVHIRDTDTEADIWRRCKHALFHEDSHEEHQHQDQPEPQEQAQGPQRRADKQAPAGGDRGHRRPDPDWRGRAEAAREDIEPQRKAARASAHQDQAHRRQSWRHPPPRARAFARAPRQQLTPHAWRPTW